jgi:hypothetical protein
MVDFSSCSEANAYDSLGGYSEPNEINLNESDKTLYGAIDTMFEIRYPNKDIKIFTKLR